MVRRATSPFSVGRQIVNTGDLFDDDDPILSGRDGLFEPVEQATRGPGEVRGKVRSHVCDVCGKEAATKAGLSAHKRTHDSDES